QERRRLRDRCRDGVLRRDDVCPPPAKLRLIVLEDRRNVTEAEPVERMEVELLEAVPEHELAPADRFGAVGEDRAEAAGRSRERAGRGGELVGEARSR